MTNLFTNSFYYQAMLKRTCFSSIVEDVKKTSKFHYGELDFNSYSQEYNSEYWLSRKIKIIPELITKSCGDTIFHLANAIFLGIPKAFQGDSRYLKSHVFSFARDMQEIAGYITMLFNDRYGLYLVEESRFQKTCYQYFTQDFDELAFQNEISMQIKELLGKGEGSEAVTLIDNSFDFHSSAHNQLFLELAKTYFNVKDLDNTSKMLKKINSEFRTIEGYESLVKDLIREHLKNGVPNKANEIISNCLESDFSNRDQVYLEVAKNYHNLGDLENTLIVLKKIKDIRPEVQCFAFKVVAACLEDKDLAKALDIIENVLTPSSYLCPLYLDQSFLKVAEYYFELGNLKNTQAILKKIIEIEPEVEDFASKVITTCLGREDPTKALDIIENVLISPSRIDQSYLKVAEYYFELGDLENTLIIFSKRLLTGDKFIKLFSKLTIEYLKKDGLCKALEITNNNFKDSDLIDYFYFEIAEYCNDLGDLENTLIVFKKITAGRLLLQDFAPKVITTCLGHNDPANALDIIEKVLTSSSRIDQSFFKVAEYYFEVGDLENTLVVLKKITVEWKPLQDFAPKVITTCLEHNDPNKALDIIENVLTPSSYLYPFYLDQSYLKVAGYYFEVGDLENTLVVLKKIERKFTFEVENFANKLMTSCLEHKDPTKALDAISFLKESFYLDGAYFKVAEYYLLELDLENILTTLSEVRNSLGFEDFAYKSVTAYLKHNDPTKAIDIIEKSLASSGIKDHFYFLFAEHYFALSNPDLENTLTLLKKIKEIETKVENFALKVMTTFLERNDPTKALDIIENVLTSPLSFPIDKSYSLIDHSYLKVAEYFFELGDLDETAEVLIKIRNKAGKSEKLFSSLIDAYLKKGWHSKAVDNIHKFNQRKKPHLLKVAHFCLASGDLDCVEDIVSELSAGYRFNFGNYFHPVTKCPETQGIALKLIRAYLDNNNPSQADRSLIYLEEENEMENHLCFEIAKCYFASGDINKCQKILHNIVLRNFRNKTAAFKNVKALVDRKDIKQAFKAINAWLRSVSISENHPCIIAAEEYLDKDDLDNALKELENIKTSDHKSKDLILKFAQKCLQLNNVAKLEEAFDKIHFSLKDIIFKELTKFYTSIRDNSAPIRLVQKFAFYAIRNHLKTVICKKNPENESRVFSTIIDINKVKEELDTEAMASLAAGIIPYVDLNYSGDNPFLMFILSLGKECYESIKDDFNTVSYIFIPAEIIKIATKRSNLNSYLRLQKPQNHNIFRVKVANHNILGVGDNASEDEITDAYRRLARKHHPDMHSKRKEGESDEEHRKRKETNAEYFKEIVNAYEQLKGDNSKNEKAFGG